MYVEVTYKRLSQNKYEISVEHESMISPSKGIFLDQLEKVASVCAYSYTEKNKIIKEAMALTRSKWS